MKEQLFQGRKGEELEWDGALERVVMEMKPNKTRDIRYGGRDRSGQLIVREIQIN